MNPNSIAARIMSDPSASYPLKAAVRTFLDCDPVDALNDAEALAEAMRDHYQLITGSR